MIIKFEELNPKPEKCCMCKMSKSIYSIEMEHKIYYFCESGLNEFKSIIKNFG